MDEATIADVRRFNRTVTQRVGALNDHFLGRGRPLGEARVLWEIGEDGCDVRELRVRLDLDSGYLSRILRSLESAGLITVGTSEHDRRRRIARLTKKGRAERALYDERSDALARSLVEPLTGHQRERLISAMGVVERLLTTALVEIEVIDPDSRDALYCLREYFAELDRRFDNGFDPGTALRVDPEETRLPAGAFLVARLHGRPIGCGSLRFHGAESAELKRLWVAADARGLGVGRRLLCELERVAAENGHRTIRLDTNRNLTEAIAMYRSAGYREIDPYNDEPYAHHWFEKHLA